MPRTRKTGSSKSAPQARIDQFFTAKKVEKLLKVPNNPPEETEVEQEQEQHEQEQQQEQEQEQVQVQSQSQNSDTQTDEKMLEEEFEEDLDDDEDDDWDDGEIVDDNELMNLLENTKETRERLKTGGLEELVADFEEFEDNLITTSGVGKTRHGSKKRITQGEARLPAAVKQQLGQANAMYIAKDYGQAIDLLQDLITKHPNVHQAWNTLGLVHEEMGNKERSLQLRMVAAHINQTDVSLWKELGVKSLENNATKQALYCFSKVLAVDPLDIDVLWDRSFLLKQMGRFDEAIDGFQQILSVIPHHLKVVNELVRIYRAQGRTKEAIELYEEAIQHHLENDIDEDEERMRDDEPEDFKDKLGYAEVNMLSELYLMQNEYRRALDWIKTGIRYVQGRKDEEWWQNSEYDNDDEYFERDDNDNDGLLRADIPIELRIRMGICRVYLGDVRIASKHFSYLFRYSATTYPDLHQDIAYAYLDKRHYDLALEVFQKIIDVSDEVEMDLLIRTADCYFQVGELETAALFYVNVLEEQPDNLDVMMSLASVYEEQGYEEKALELVDFVMKKNREDRKKKRDEERQKKEESEKTEREQQEQEEETSSKTRMGKQKKASIFDEAARERVSPMEIRRRNREQMLREEEEKELKAQSLYAKIKDLDQITTAPAAELDRTLVREYIRVAQEMWRDFSETSAFFLSDRQKYTGFYAFRRLKPKTRSILRDALQMAHRLRRKTGTEQYMDEDEDLDEDERGAREEEQKEIDLSLSNHFRQIPFTEWCRIIVKYATMLAVSKPAEKAYDVLKRAEEANVFYHDRTMRTTIKIALLGCAAMNRNEIIMEESCRWLLRTYPFESDPLRIYSAITGLANDAVTTFSSYSNMKQLMRTVRAMDAVVARQTGAGENERAMKEIKRLNSAINAQEADPFAANEALMAQFYQTPGQQEMQSINRLLKEGVALPTRVNPVLFVLFGQQMSLGRNFMSASLFFLRAYAIQQDDPLIMLQTGIAMLLRAMSRKSVNRHYQLLQGMMFIQKYYRARNKNQEAEFNLGRAFHQLGLTHLAVDHYERVLIMPSAAYEGKMEPGNIEDVYDISKPPLMDENDDTDLKREAAYNLHIIYATSGSFDLSQVLLHKYCTI